jgi:hypothetical protein
MPAKMMQHATRSNRFSITSISEHHLPCLAHVLNLAIVAVMSDITWISTIETMAAIWEFDPTLPNNYLLGDSLDVVSAVKTLTIKVCSTLIA